MNKEVIVLILATCVLGYLKVSFEYQNWTHPELDTSSISKATPQLNRIDVESVQLFSLYSNFYNSIAGESELRAEGTQIETIALDELVSNIEEPKNPDDDDIVEVPPPPPPLPPAPPTIEIIEVDEGTMEEEIEFDESDVQYEEDTEIEIIEVDEDLEDDTPFMTVEKMPALGPCKSMSGDERQQCTQMEIMKYVNNNTKYPIIAKENNIQGTVLVYFVVGKDGNVKDIRILREVDPWLEKEAKRVVKSLPTFEPGQQRGKNVSVQYTIPVKFVIREDIKAKEESESLEIEEVEETQTEEVQETQTEEVQEEASDPKPEKKRRGKKGRKKKK